MTGCCRKIFNNGLNSKAVWFPAPIHICRESRIWTVCLFQTNRKLPAWIMWTLSPLAVLRGRKIQSSLLQLLCCILLWGPAFHVQVSSSRVAQASSVLFGKVSLLKKATTVGTGEDTLGWWLTQIFVCGSCVRDASISACHQPFCSLWLVPRSWLTPACLSVQNGNVCCSVDLECLNNNWHSQTGLCRGRKTDEVNTWNEVVCIGVLYNRQLPKSPHEEDVWELPLGPITMLILASLVWVTYSTAHISQWLLKVFSVVNYTLFLSRHLQIRLNYFMGKLMLYFCFNLCIDDMIEFSSSYFDSRFYR